MQTSLCPYCMSEVQGETCPYCGRNISCAGDPTHLPAGYILEDKRNYILGAALGQGGFGVTYIAWDETRKQKVAIKEYFPTYCSSRLDGRTVSAYRGQEETYLKGKERFLDEARMLKSLSDLKSVVNVLDFFEANNSAYLVMEYLEGMSLKDCIQRNGKLPAQQFLNQLKPLMADMEKMHRRGVVHRDIAPDNIILLPDGRLKLIDFGAARSYVGDKSMTVVVKKGFAPVEQYMRKGSNASTDVYALAATIYYCITGIVPPDSAERQYGEVSLQSPIMLGADLLPHQEGALEQALQIQPKDRLQSIADFMVALEKESVSVKKSEKTVSKPKAKQEEKNRAKNKRFMRWIPAAVVVLAFCIGGVFLLTGRENLPVSMQTEENQPPILETQLETVLSPLAIKYNEAVDLFYSEEYGKAAIAFAKLGDYRDAKEISLKIWEAIAKRQTILADVACTIAIKADGTVEVCGSESPDVSEWTDVISMVSPEEGSYFPKAALRADGTVIVTDTRNGSHMIRRDGWEDIVAIECVGNYLVGLKYDGTLVATSREFPNADYWISDEEEAAYQKKIAGLSDVVEFGEDLAKFADGTVMVDFEISEQKDVIERVTCENGVVWLKRDGTVLFEPAEEGWESRLTVEMKEDLAGWTDIVSITGSGWDQILGLKADGTVVATGDNIYHQLDVEEWTDIVAINSGWYYSVGLKTDGTFVSIGSTKNNVRKPTETWTDLKLPADREALLSQIRPMYITDSSDEDAEHATDISDNILMGLGVSEIELNRISTRTEAKRIIPDYPIFNLSVKRNDVRSITFLNTLASAPGDAVDASALSNGKVKAWAMKNGELYDVFVAAEGGVLAPENCKWLFGFLPNMTQINFNDAFDTSEVTSMIYLFDSCEALPALNLSCFDTSNVTDMGAMFMDCVNLESIDVTSFNTENVTDMGSTFSGCKSLKTLDVTGFNTANVMNMSCMFLQCNVLEELDLSSFDVSNVTDAFNMFFKCPAKHPDWYDHTMN